MRLLLDTNIVVDVLSKRGGYEDSPRVLQYCETKRVEGLVTATTVTVPAILPGRVLEILRDIF